MPEPFVIHPRAAAPAHSAAAPVDSAAPAAPADLPILRHPSAAPSIAAATGWIPPRAAQAVHRDRLEPTPAPSPPQAPKAWHPALAPFAAYLEDPDVTDLFV